MQKKFETSEQVATKLANYMVGKLNTPQGKRMPFAALLQSAIETYYESKTGFFKAFLSRLNEDEVEAFYALLHQKMRLGHVDSDILSQISDALKKAGASKAVDADAAQTRSPSSTTGRGPYTGKRER